MPLAVHVCLCRWMPSAVFASYSDLLLISLLQTLLTTTLPLLSTSPHSSPIRLFCSHECWYWTTFTTDKRFWLVDVGQSGGWREWYRRRNVGIPEWQHSLDFFQRPQSMPPQPSTKWLNQTQLPKLRAACGTPDDRLSQDPLGQSGTGKRFLRIPLFSAVGITRPMLHNHLSVTDAM